MNPLVSFALLSFHGTHVFVGVVHPDFVTLWQEQGRVTRPETVGEADFETLIKHVLNVLAVVVQQRTKTLVQHLEKEEGEKSRNLFLEYYEHWYSKIFFTHRVVVVEVVEGGNLAHELLVDDEREVEVEYDVVVDGQTDDEANEREVAGRDERGKRVEPVRPALGLVHKQGCKKQSEEPGYFWQTERLFIEK